MPVYYLEDLKPGETFRSARIKVTAEDIKRFARAFDPQPFHTDEEAAKDSFFGGLAASGWHTAALTMRLIVDAPFQPAGGQIGARLEEIRWPRPVRPGDELRAETAILEARSSESRPGYGWLRVRTTTFNQKDEPVQIYTGNLIVKSRANALE
jgi:acyl dehydratase